MSRVVDCVKVKIHFFPKNFLKATFILSRVICARYYRLVGDL